MKVQYQKFINSCLGSLWFANLHTPENATLGQSFKLTCEVHTSLPVTTNLLSAQWKHGGSPITTCSDKFVLKKGSGTGPSEYVTNLNLNESSVKDAGLYSCEVFLDTDRQQVIAENNLTLACKYTASLH